MTFIYSHSYHCACLKVLVVKIMRQCHTHVCKLVLCVLYGISRTIPNAYGVINSMDTRFVQYSNQSENVYSKLINNILHIIRVEKKIPRRVVSNKNMYTNYKNVKMAIQIVKYLIVFVHFRHVMVQPCPLLC